MLGIAFFCGQIEEALTTHRAHVQFHISLVNPLELSTVKRKLERLGILGVHLEPCRGRRAGQVDPEFNIRYCTDPAKRHAEYPEGTFSFGERPANPGKRGARTDLQRVAQIARTGEGDLRTIIAQYPTQFIRYTGGIQSLCSHYRPARDFKTEVYWFFGSSGSGKSRAIRDIVGEHGYWKNPTNKWWDGYLDQHDVVIDDFRAEHFPYSEFLRLCDRYPCQVEVKGNTIQFRPKRIFVSCPKSPTDAFVDSGEDIVQVTRRITNTMEFMADDDARNTVLLKQSRIGLIEFLKGQTPDPPVVDAEAPVARVADDDGEDGISLGSQDSFSEL
jgi:hypothetical protein